MVAAQNMHMGAAVGTLEYSGYQNIVSGKGAAADGTTAFHIAVNAVPATAYMHQAVLAPGYGRKGLRFDQLTAFQLCRTDGAGLRIAGGERYFLKFLPPGSSVPTALYRPTAKNETVSNSKQDNAYNDKSQ